MESFVRVVHREPKVIFCDSAGLHAMVSPLWFLRSKGTLQSRLRFETTNDNTDEFQARPTRNNFALTRSLRSTVPKVIRPATNESRGKR